MKLSLKNFSPAAKSWPWLIAAAMLIVLLLFIFRKVPLPTENPIEKYLQQQNDSLARENEKVAKRMQELDLTIDSLLGAINSNDTEIQKIYINVERTVHTYDNWSPRQLERFFTDRYAGKD